ncbi:biosynthetic-type acetolactate synthase large subunit [bacterium]|nr:biosynthetic-type acetolactate synthase large subunit [bacterium]
MKKSGAKIFVDTLIEHGVDTIFGFPGGAVLPIYDQLYQSPVRHILTRHEQGAIHAADGYARVTGKAGICIATSGPGATNLVTGLANAFMDSVPLIAFSGQVPTSMIGNDSFQEADIYGITIPVTKYNYLVKDVNNLRRVLDEAFHIARTGRPGPVLIDIPKDVQIKETEFWEGKEIDLPPNHRADDLDIQKQIKRAAEAIRNAKRPVLYVGGGAIISGASEPLKKLAEKASIPVTTTLMGKGSFPETHPLSLGMLGMHGTKYANYAVTEADLLIAIGARFDDRVTGDIKRFAPNAGIIHIDIDPAEISKIIKVDIPMVGDANDILSALCKMLESKRHPEWLDKIAEWKRDYPLSYDKSGNEIKPQYVVEKIYEVTKGDAIIATEVGQNQMWAAQYYLLDRPRSFVSSGGLGTMGFGFPASIGAKVGCPDRVVFDIAGDGSFQMTIQELATAVQDGINVKIAILNNGYLGMVRQWQEIFFGRRYSSTCLGKSPDFVAIAKGYGAEGIRVTKPEDVEPAIKQALQTDKPVVIDFCVSPEENVFPMVPPGEAIDKMLDQGSGK